MLDNNTLELIQANLEDLDALFKEGQKRIIQKLNDGEQLTENEKRYLRGLLGKKIEAIGLLIKGSSGRMTTHPFQFLSDYYITGYEALKHNGYGWFYDTRTIFVINTRLKGSMDALSKRIVFIRRRSLKGSDLYKDPDSGLFYATNEQVLRDARAMKDESLVRTWWAMFFRYPDTFVKNAEEYHKAMPIKELRDIGDFGV